MLESPKLEKPLLHIWHNHSSQVELNCHVLGWLFIHCSCLWIGTYRNKFI